MKNKILELINERTQKLGKLWEEEDKIQEEYLKKIEELLCEKRIAELFRMCV